MTFEEYIKVYETKTGDKHICPSGYTTLYDKDKGYAQYKVENNRLWVYEVCGDGKYWYSLGIRMCKDHNIPYLCTICTRDILPYIRLMKGKITKKEIQPERNNAYRLEGVNHLGLRFFVWAAWWDGEKQQHAYYVISEVINNDKSKI